MKPSSALANAKSSMQFSDQPSKLKSAIQLAIVSLSLSAISNAAIAEEQTSEVISLKEISVVGKAESDTKPVKGYNAKKSRTATKTETD
ncbi:MAG: hypothetical protein B7Y34_01725, partial [Methylophilales bacterium 16-45-9]